MNFSMVRQLRRKVEHISSLVQLGEGDLVIDIGANDSTLLQAYSQPGLELVGIDPSARKFAQCYPTHVALVPEFFSAELVKRRFPERRAKVVTSIAMFYDLEQPMNFVRDVVEILGDDGLWVFEQSYLPAMLDTTSYDTVCHEHLEYYALKQVKRMTDAAGLKIVDIEFNDVNGGSFSIAAAKAGSPYPDARAAHRGTLDDWRRRALDALDTYRRFAQRAQQHTSEPPAPLQPLQPPGGRGLGY